MYLKGNSSSAENAGLLKSCWMKSYYKVCGVEVSGVTSVDFVLAGRETVGSSSMEHDVSMECDVSMERDVSMEHGVNLRFRQQLLLIDEHLVAEDVAALKFLCTDLLPFRKLEGVKSALDIFQLLMVEEYLNEENTFLLAELLYRIKYHSLLNKLGYTKEKVQECLHEKGRVSPYR